MAEKIVKTGDITEQGIKPVKGIPKEVLETLRGRIVIINPQSEIAKNLEIKEKGVFGARFR
jgi:RNA polymerase subunit RPABC4/transcription elongation factor Spt4